MTTPPPHRKARRRLLIRFLTLWLFFFFAFAALAALPIFTPDRNVDTRNYSIGADEALSPGAAGVSPISAVITWRIGQATFLGQAVATYIHSSIVWAPSRPSDEALRSMYAALLRSQPLETVAWWQASDYEERLLQPQGAPYRRFRLDGGAWVVPFTAAVIAALVTFAWSFFSAIRKQRRAERGQCRECGYDRSTLDPSRQCPEYGKAP